MKRALITGITGQDGSHLAELLLGKGYEVHGVVRRSSSFNTGRIDEIYQDPHVPDRRLVLHYGDLNDASSLNTILRQVRPDEIYNLGAQSHVRVSFDVPEYTGEVTGLGTLRLLEAVRESDLRPRFYQASSSELFGSAPPPQSEATPFQPRSPYACAKAYAYYITKNYREAYGLFAVNGILFNHECVTAETPVFVRRDGLLDLVPIEDLVPHRTHPHTGTRFTTEVGPADAFEVWDARGWTRVTCMTATWNGSGRRPAKVVHRVAARGAVFQATADHVVFTRREDRPTETPAGEVQPGDLLPLIRLPESPDVVNMTEDEAWLLGMLAAEGYVSAEGKLRVVNQDHGLLNEVAACWRRVTGGGVRWSEHPSGFAGGEPVTRLDFTAGRSYGRYVHDELNTRSGDQRVPRRVLNASSAARLAFLRGFNAGDGLRSTPCTYEFQGFKTSSAVLAAGLYWLAVGTLRQRAIICVEDRDGRRCFQINLNSPNVPGEKGQHLRRPLEEVVDAGPVPHRGWLFDLATETGTFHAGIGQGWIHNSPRRGETFVTRKITRAVARIKLGRQDKLFLGNLKAKRDWGYAPEFCEAMWLMLQQDRPDDYVVATGETHSVEEFLDETFGYLGLDWHQHVEIDPRYFRPAEVDALCGDATKAARLLGWKPKVTFRELARIMVDADLRLAQAPGR
ncbi:MAG: GDP-mannose 4,6-dehydratase [Deltaproteobacteria bacterium]|nr:GDP-mannose 4,6-dehydratase [Deltaproteobacteria bacterium]